MRHVFFQPDQNDEKNSTFYDCFCFRLFIYIDALKLLDFISRFEGKSAAQLQIGYLQLKLYPACLNLLHLVLQVMIIPILVVLGRCLILHHNYYVYSHNKPKIVKVPSMYCLNFDFCYHCITAAVLVSPECKCCWPLFLVIAFCCLLVDDSFP